VNALHKGDDDDDDDDNNNNNNSLIMGTSQIASYILRRKYCNNKIKSSLCTA
jgi:hypothetical protein